MCLSTRICTHQQDGKTDKNRGPWNETSIEILRNWCAENPMRMRDCPITNAGRANSMHSDGFPSWPCLQPNSPSPLPLCMTSCRVLSRVDGRQGSRIELPIPEAHLHAARARCTVGGTWGRRWKCTNNTPRWTARVFPFRLTFRSFAPVEKGAWCF